MMDELSRATFVFPRDRKQVAEQMNNYEWTIKSATEQATLAQAEHAGMLTIDPAQLRRMQRNDRIVRPSTVSEAPSERLLAGASERELAGGGGSPRGGLAVGANGPEEQEVGIELVQM